MVSLGTEVIGLQLSHSTTLHFQLLHRSPSVFSLPEPDGLKDFPVEKEPGKTDLTLMRQNMAVNPMGSMVWVEPWWQKKHRTVLPSG